MAINLKKSVIDFDTAVTRTEFRAASSEQSVDMQPEEETKQAVVNRLSANDIKLIGDGNKNKGVIRRRRKKSDKKKVLEKKRREQQAREQASRAGKARRYTKEMRNRDAISQAAKRKRQEAMLTVTSVDDRLANAALAADSAMFDHLVYGTSTSDIDTEMDEMFDDIID